MLNSKTFGEGDPIIILHGLFGMLDNWQSIAKKLATEYMVVLIDQRDHGKSEHTEEFSYPILAEDLHKFMEDNWLFEARLIGHSMGGKTAMQFANEYPDMVEQMVVVDIGPKEYKPRHENIFKALLSVPVKEIKSRTEAERILSEYIDDVGVRLFLMKNLKRNKEGGFTWKMNLDLLFKEYPNIISGLSIEEPIDVDTLFLYGAKSKYIQDHEIPNIRSLFTNSKFESIDAGHWIHAEKPDELLNSMDTFFKEKN